MIQTQQRINHPAIAVAQDVLDHLDALRGIRTGVYLGTSTFLMSADSVDDSASNYADQLGEHCSVCALGAAFISYVRLNAGPSLGSVFCKSITGRFKHEMDSRKTLYPALHNIFEDEQLSFIESAFEMCAVRWSSGSRTCLSPSVAADDMFKAVEFGRRHYERPVERLSAIMQNIVDNDGFFRP